MLVFKVRRLTGMIAVFGMILATSMKANAQERVAANVGADLVSSYVWRGQDLGNAAIQPNLSLNYRGFSLSAWGSVGLVSEDVKELDLTLGYAIGDFLFHSPIIGLTPTPNTLTMLHIAQPTYLKFK